MADVSRRQGLILTAVASVVLLLAMSPAENRMKDTGGPGMVPFELTGGQDRADEILAEWGEDGRDAIENVSLLLTLDDAGAAFPLLATIFASLKFLLLAITIAYLLAGLGLRLLRRDAATPTP